MEGENKMIGIIASIATVVGGVCSTISGALATVGSVIVKGAIALVQQLPTVISGLEIMGNVMKVISMIGQLLGISPEDEKIDELGAKIIQEETRPKLPEETAEEYLNYLRNEVQLDRGNFDNLSDEDKLACAAIGTRMVTDVIEEKTGMALSSDFLVAVGKSNMDYTEVKMFIEKFKEEGITSLDCVSQYLKNDLDPREVPKTDSIIVAALKELNPEISTEEVRERIITMKQENNKVH